MAKVWQPNRHGGTIEMQARIQAIAMSMRRSKKAGETIARTREAKNLTIEECLRHCSLTAQQWEEIESGQQILDVESLTEIAAGLELKASELMRLIEEA